MKKLLFAFLLIILLLFFGQDVFAEDSFCLLYFTYIGCPNCAYTDPVVLSQWPQKYSKLVIIEYMWHGDDFGDPNSQFFGRFAQKYKAQAAVPQVIINKNNIRLGRIDVPKAEIDIQLGIPNPCPLIDKSIYFEEVDLNKLPGRPKIWANQRILIKLDESNWLFQWNGEKPPETAGNERLNQTEVKELLFTDNISEKLENKIFEIAEPQKVLFSGIAFPGFGCVPYQEFENAIKINISEKARVIEREKEIKPEEIGAEEEIEIPIFGWIKIKSSSLPLLTAIFAIADGLTNPCGFFVLIFLLSALVGLAGARKKILLVGSIFVLFFIIYYFLFMALLLNVFMLGKKLAIITTFAGIICLFLGILNIKDYFFFGKGISFSLSEKKKIQLSERVKELSLEKSNLALIVSSTVIASGISLVAILCTLGIPFAFTKVLSIRELSALSYYFYLVLYNLIYALPMLFIISLMAIFLGKSEFSVEWIKRLKLLSGFIILFLGIVLIWKFTLLENVIFMLWLLFSALLISGTIILIDSFRKLKDFDRENK